MIIDIKKVLVPGFSLIANLKNKPFHCKISDEKTDDGFLVRLSKPDQTAFAVVVNSICALQCVTDDGYVCKFESKVLSVAIPLLGFSYPKNDLEGSNVRKQQRVPVSFWTAILGVVTENRIKKLKPVGDGSIVDMNMDGCRVMTSVKYKVNDTIFLSFEYQEGKDPVSFDGKVRMAKPAPHGLTYYGVRYEEPESELLEAIQLIMENPDL